MAISVTVTAPSRLHFGLMQLSRSYSNTYGGFGAALSEPHWCIEASVKQGTTQQIDGLCEEHERYALGVLSRLQERLAMESLSITVHSSVPPHVGLGSKTSLGNALLAAGTMIAGRKGGRTTHQYLLERGGASGIGVNCLEAGGFILDAGHQFTVSSELLPSGAQRPAELPAIVGRWPTDSVCVLLARAPGSVGLYADAEVEFWAKNTPMSQESSSTTAAILMYEILPGLARQNSQQWSFGLNQLQEVGFKAREWTLQSPETKQIRDGAYAAGASTVALSGMGPTLAIFGEDLAAVSTKLRERLNPILLLSRLTDLGVSVERSPRSRVHG